MASDYFLKLEGIDGGSIDGDHPNELEIDSFSWGETQLKTGTGKPSVQDFRFVSKYGNASPRLFLLCALGKHIKQATLTCRKAGGEQQRYLKVTLTDAFITSYQMGGSDVGSGEGAADSVPTDQFSIGFTTIAFEFTPQRPDGTLGPPIKAAFNVKTSSQA